MPIQFLDHTADVLFEATGRTIEECFSQCALALCTTQAELSQIKPVRKISVQVSAENEEKLLHAFLCEVLYQMQVTQMAFADAQVKITKGKKWACRSSLRGGDMAGHTKTDVKAVTWNQFSLAQKDNKWKATVLLDV